MIGVIMCVDDIANWFVGYSADGQKQALANLDAATGIDQGDCVLSDDNAEIGDIAGIFGRRERDLAEMGIVAVRDLLHGEGCALCSSLGCGAERQYRADQDAKGPHRTDSITPVAPRLSGEDSDHDAVICRLASIA